MKTVLFPLSKATAASFLIGLTMLPTASGADRGQEPTAPGGRDRVVHLFNGKNLDGWTNVDGAPVKEGWTVEDGALVRTGRGGAIYAKGQYDDFVLDFDWAIAPGGNSGVKYRVRFYRKGPWGHPAWLGCEYQIRDNSKRPDAFYSKTSAGALYGIYAPNKNKHLKPVGKYNHSRIVVHGTRIEHWLNGRKIVEADTSSRDWRAHVAQSKFAPVQGFAQNRRGRIQLQDHGSKVWFRNITLRPLSATVTLASDRQEAAAKIIFEDRLDGKPGPGWRWLREVPESWRTRNGALEIRVQPGVANTVNNALVRKAPDRRQGTYAIEVTVTNTVKPSHQYEQAGITWYHDGKPVFKLVKELVNGKRLIIPGRKSIGAATVQLRLVVAANTYTAQYRADGAGPFRTAATGKLPAPGNDEVSIQCYNGPPDAVHWIRFSNFRISKLPR